LNFEFDLPQAGGQPSCMEAQVTKFDFERMPRLHHMISTFPSFPTVSSTTTDGSGHFKLAHTMHKGF
jgi:hypothetical protein